MDICLITGSGGLIGSEAAEFFSGSFDKVIGIDNDMRAYFFGEGASTSWNVARLGKNLKNYEHFNIDIRDFDNLEKLFSEYGTDIKLILHTAAQPSHDWAAKEPFTDFTVNANGTLNMLEAAKRHCPDAVFIFTSTNKVYGDTPNLLPLVELETRWEIDSSHPYFEKGIDETMSIDSSKHSIFGASKVAADVMVQEYGRYFGMKTAVFRGGCLTGPNHSGAQLHGFLSYLVKCAVTDTPYTIFGYKGKQVRDNIHSYDMINAFSHFYKAPRSGVVYNMGGSRHSCCSMLEAIAMLEKLTGRPFRHSYTEDNRSGDHIWWISDVSKFKNDYPEWEYTFGIERIITDIYRTMLERGTA
ncbi:NAD-dependent epimerase/dehydratase family protein [Seleniivibrio woodruffii]|uniref:NAD-dependent epimerase/dehydratase family protein n=1 Tax=Seleniivibrio woodruffii TaxID=1078050 RepID=UPI003C6F9DCF